MGASLATSLDKCDWTPRTLHYVQTARSADLLDEFNMACVYILLKHPLAKHNPGGGGCTLVSLSQKCELILFWNLAAFSHKNRQKALRKSRCRATPVPEYDGIRLIQLHIDFGCPEEGLRKVQGHKCKKMTLSNLKTIPQSFLYPC